jgi:hypothetical protein
LPHKFAPCGPYPTSMRKPHDPACGDRMPPLRGSNPGEPPAAGPGFLFLRGAETLANPATRRG